MHALVSAQPLSPPNTLIYFYYPYTHFQTMKSFAAVAVCALIASTEAFAPATPIRNTNIIASSSTLLRAAELMPEPEGGEELTKASSSMEGSRMKNMGVEDEGEGIYNFWLSASADGAKIKQIRQTTEREASSKANFPGFRKGQVPPYAQPQITGFAVQEAIIKTCEGSLEAYGLESLTGSAGEVTVLEDIKDLCKGYKLGTDVSFTATYKGKFDSSVQAAMESSTEESAEDVVVDVEAVSE